MENKRKLIISGIILAVLIIIVVAVVIIEKVDNKNNDSSTSTAPPVQIINYRTLSDGTKLNESPKLKVSKQFEGLDITGIQITCEQPTSTNDTTNSLVKGKTEMLATLTNNTNQTLGGYDVNITFVDEKGNSISDFKVFARIIELKPGESTQLNASITENLINAYDIKIEKVVPASNGNTIENVNGNVSGNVQ